MSEELKQSEANDVDFPQGVKFIRLSGGEWVFLLLAGGFITAVMLALLALLFVAVRFFWALALG